jgi:hypothetical protein
MSDPGDPVGEQVPDDQQWPTHCQYCGTRLVSATLDFDKTNPDRPELRPGEMVSVDYCPNADCPSNRAEDEGGSGAAAGLDD